MRHNSIMKTGQVLFCLLFLAVAACRGSEPSGIAADSLTSLPDPGGAGAALPHLAVDTDGAVWLSWVEPVDGGHALRLARLEDEGWRPVSEVARGLDWFINWADFPAVVPLPGGVLAAHWLQKTPGGVYSYRLRVSTSRDRGQTWSEPLSPHRDGTRTEHGFASVFPWGDGGALVWLDGRMTPEDLRADDGHEGGHDGAMTLYWTRFDAEGAPEPESLLDARVCDCCQTDVAMTAAGPIVVYRDRSENEVRDIGIVRWQGTRWSEPAHVHRDGWRMPACPVNGPAADALGRTVAVAWFTAAQDRPRVNLAFSSDAGAHFDGPIEVDGGVAIGRVDVTLLEDGSAGVSWVARAGEGAELRFRSIGRSGERGPIVVVSPTSASRAAGFPQMVRAGDRILFAWTEPREPSRLRTALSRPIGD